MRTYRECYASGKFIALKDVYQERDDGDQDRCKRPRYRPENSVDASYVCQTVISVKNAEKKMRISTFEEPFHFYFSNLQSPLYPTVLPSKKFDELHLKGVAINSPMAKHSIDLTAPMSSLTTPMRLSLAASKPFCIRILLLAR
jgi:hypothetical protein